MKKFLVLALILFSIPVFIYFYYKVQIDVPANESKQEIIFKVSLGDNAEIISNKLEQLGLIKSAAFFQFYVWQDEIQNKLQAGEYVFDTGMSIKEIANKLASGKINNRERTIKILEGWTIADIDEYLNEQKIIEAGDFVQLSKKAPAEFALIKLPVEVDLEGYLFPDTYRIFNDASTQDIINKLLNTFENKISPTILEEIKKQEKTVHEVITLASIIEKEVRSEQDMALVSGVLQKRLKIDMPLEVDSSINYVTGKNTPSVDYADLQIDSPYNTYKNYGLPPGPISNPGLAAIRAAIHPKESEFLFYLNRQDSGETIFSKTYDEHLANKYKYLK
ncbi:MAG: endolytic transglycosylase MltG [Patescibacteria group bacterium]|nr:endolytic transglycosylase MltG [Patescibacteria group bacterium]